MRKTTILILRQQQAAKRKKFCCNVSLHYIRENVNRLETALKGLLIHTILDKDARRSVVKTVKEFIRYYA